MNTPQSTLAPFGSSSQSGGSPFPFDQTLKASSPFSAAPQSPFSAAPQSPFSATNSEVMERSMPEPGKPAKIPAPRAKPVDTPFQVVQEAYPALAASIDAQSPFSPSSPVATPAVHSPFAVSRPSFTPAPFPSIVPPPSSVSSSWNMPTPFHSASKSAAPQTTFSAAEPEYYQNYQQLELRAIFGVDREMSAEEIMQRARALPSIRMVSRIDEQDLTALHHLRCTLQSIGVSNGTLRIFAGNSPIEFIQEGNTTLVVQTDGGFAPGIRETLMIITRELEKMGLH
jgi:hypothetical protein